MIISSLKKNEAFILFELDVVLQWLANVWSLDLMKEKQFLDQVAQEIVHVVSTEISAVSLSPQFGYGVLENLPPHVGSIIRLTTESKEVAVGPAGETVPLVSPNWNVIHARNNYSVALVETEYHPLAQNAVIKRQWLAELSQTAAHEGIDLALSIGWTKQASSLDDISAKVLTLQEFRQYAQLFSLPVGQHDDALGLATLTAELTGTPWVVKIIDDFEYEVAKDKVRLGLDSGAVGAWIGMMCCQPLEKIFSAQDQGSSSEPTQKNLSDVLKVLETTVRDRAIEMNRILSK